MVIIGGGLVGCEEGLAMAMEGKDVTILEMRDTLAPDAPVLHFKAMMLEFDKVKEHLNAVTGAACVEVTGQGVWAKGADGEKALYPADTVVIATGMRALDEEVEALRGCAEDFITVGDCIKPGKVLQAVSGGYFAGKNA